MQRLSRRVIRTRRPWRHRRRNSNLSRGPINLKMTNDAKIAFDTIGKLAGLTVIYDPDFPPRRISLELNNVTLEQALEIVSLESKAFVKPVTENIIFVIP